MRKVIFMLTIVVSSILLLAVACKSTPETPSPKHQVNMENFTFVPDSLSISTDDTVLWINNGSVSHTTTSGDTGVSDGRWDSGVMAPGDSFKHVFPIVGTFHYYCSLHFSMGMTGRIIVH